MRWHVNNSRDWSHSSDIQQCSVSYIHSSWKCSTWRCSLDTTYRLISSKWRTPNLNGRLNIQQYIFPNEEVKLSHSKHKIWFILSNSFRWKQKFKSQWVNSKKNNNSRVQFSLSFFLTIFAIYSVEDEE